MLLTLPLLQGILQMAGMLELPGDLLSWHDSPNEAERGKQHKRMHQSMVSIIVWGTCEKSQRMVDGSRPRGGWET